MPDSMIRVDTRRQQWSPMNEDRSAVKSAYNSYDGGQRRKGVVCKHRHSKNLGKDNYYELNQKPQS